MAWTTPKTWSSEPLTSADLNTYVRDNQEALYGRLPGAESFDGYVTAVSASTTSDVFVDVDGTNLSFTITTVGNDVGVWVTAEAHHDAAGSPTNDRRVWVGLAVDSVDVEVHAQQYEPTVWKSISFFHVITGLSAGEHTITLRFRSGTNGSGTADIEVTSMYVRELIGAS